MSRPPNKMLTRNQTKLLGEQGFLVEVSRSRTGQGWHTRWTYPEDLTPNVSLSTIAGESPPEPHAIIESSPSSVSSESTFHSPLTVPELLPELAPENLERSPSGFERLPGGYLRRRVNPMQSSEEVERKMVIKLNMIRERELGVLVRNWERCNKDTTDFTQKRERLMRNLEWKRDTTMDVDTEVDTELESCFSGSADEHSVDEGFGTAFVGEPYICRDTMPAKERDTAPPIPSKQSRLLARTDTEIIDTSVVFMGAAFSRPG
ncbi:hypothetical protein C0991_001002 [Blastosporella zonata]|nr:hypothetical protein C0991_001002 [Blastosporella zonata]